MNWLKTNLYIVIITLVGLVLVFLVPPFQAPDEQTHLYRAYQLSDFDLFGDRLSYGAGDTLPASLSQTFEIFTPLLFNPEAKVTGTMMQTAWNVELRDDQRIETRFENTAVYPPLAYVPQITGVMIGKILSLGPLPMLYFVRLLNFSAWILIIYFNMRRNRQLSLAIFAFALVPIVAFQASSASGDVLTSALALTLALELYRAIKSKKVSPRSYYFVGVIGVTLALCKTPYILIILLALLLPQLNGRALYRRTAKTLVIAIPLLIAALWTILAERTFLNLRQGANASAQLDYIVGHPLDYAITLISTYVGSQSDLLYIQMVGQLGWLDTKLPLWCVLFTTTSILLSILSTNIKSRSSKTLIWLRILSGIILLALIGAITSSLYLTFTSVGSGVVDGLQGRYFIALWPLLLLALGGLLALKPAQQARAERIIYCLVVPVVLCTLLTLTYRYYPI